MRIVEEGTLLLSFKLTLGRLAFAGRRLRTNEAIAALNNIDIRKLSKEYLYWYLTYFDWASAAEGEDKIKGKTLNKAKLGRLPVFLPPLAEQRRIVAILDEAFDGIAAATANAERNKVAVDDLFGAHFQKIVSDHSEWSVRPLIELADNLDGRRRPVTKNVRTSGDIPYYGASGVVDYVKDFLFDEPLLLISEDGANLLMRTYPIAFSISGKTWVNNHAHVLRFENLAMQRFVAFYLNSISLARYVSGMAQPKLNQAAMNSILVPVPPNEVLGEIVRCLEQSAVHVGNLRRAYTRKLAALAELKQSLLARAFAGALTGAEGVAA